MSNDFANVTYDEQATQTTTGLDAPVHAEEIDLNDPRLTSESIDVNPEGDAYATPPPPPDGKYRAKLKQIDVKDGKGQLARFTAKLTKDGNPYLYTGLEARIQDPTGKLDNIPVFDRWVGTFLNRDGSTKVTTILSKLGVAVPSKANHAQLMELFLKTLAAEPDITIETSWEASCQACVEEAKKSGSKAPRSIMGMNRFPQDSKGQPIAAMPCPIDKKHGDMVAQARIVGFEALKK